MITIEQMYFRRGEDVMVLVAHDVNIDNQTTVAVIASKPSVKVEEAQEIPSGRMSWMMKLFCCCLPIRSGSSKRKSHKKKQSKNSDTEKKQNKGNRPNVLRRLFGRNSGNGQSEKASRSIFRRLTGSKSEDKVLSIEDISQAIENKYGDQLEYYNSI